MNATISWDAVSEKTVWDLMSSRQRVDILIRDAPDSIAVKVMECVSRLNSEFSLIEQKVLFELDQIPRDIPFENQLEIARESTHPEILCAALNSDYYADLIWEKIKPSSSTGGCFCE